MGNETTKTTKPPKYILQNGYLYERIPKKKIKEAISTFDDIHQMLTVASGGSMESSTNIVKKIEEMVEERVEL